jgi:hypothetical protein
MAALNSKRPVAKAANSRALHERDSAFIKHEIVRRGRSKPSEIDIEVQ